MNDKGRCHSSNRVLSPVPVLGFSLSAEIEASLIKSPDLWTPGSRRSRKQRKMFRAGPYAGISAAGQAEWRLPILVNAANVREKTLLRRRRFTQFAKGTLVIRSACRARTFVPLDEVDQPARCSHGMSHREQRSLSDTTAAFSRFRLTRLAAVPHSCEAMHIEREPPRPNCDE